ncbi:MAG: hypothetical protein PUF27_01655 [Bacteroidales bacterium]|nr:hypothetical protein [Bacteroidales bacterium]MDD6554312.1 hypothetical protein [Bacteroidales bacterium]MDD6775052.1 hypothetical protein [Bacteroidales bacterium]
MTVNVADESGSSISGVSATLVSVKKKDGTSLNLMTSGGAISSSVLAPAAYGNGLGDSMEFLFQITGLGADFLLNKVKMDVQAVTGNGGIQSASVQRNFTFSVKTGATAETLTDFASVSGDINKNPEIFSEWTLLGKGTGSGTFFVSVKLTKNVDLGCFASLRSVTLVKPYSVNLSSTANVNNVATFSANERVEVSNDVSVCTVTVSGDKATLHATSSNAVPANQGVILRSSTATSATLYAVNATEEQTNTELTEFSNNRLQPQVEAGLPEAGDNTLYVFTKDTENNAVFKLLDTSGSPFAANKAFLSVPAGGLSILRLGSDDVQTGISSESVSESENQPELYDLFGRKVAKAVPGKIYVKGGKKFLAK